ncbi:MAG: hypothetical protein M3239_02725 [Thermoproteota archaeon]|nr:hypothetical protein [Thermoproteota archaeon]
MMGPNSLEFNLNQGILFIAGGIAQIFWIIPMIRRCDKKMGATLVCDRDCRHDCIYGYLDHNKNAR